MSEAVSIRLSSDLMEKMVREAKEKKCSLSELIRQKIMFACEQENKEKMNINFLKMESKINFNKKPAHF